MGKYEITQEQYKAIMSENPSKFKGEKYPVDSVSRADAFIFCRNASKKTGRPIRLPSDAQWEYACRAGTTSTYYFGHNERQLSDYAWHGENSGLQTHPVGQKKPNAFGLYDMYGNVQEWCRDWYAPYDKPPKQPLTDPEVDAKDAAFFLENDGTARILGVLRNAAWNGVADSGAFRSAERNPGSGKLETMGFRVIMDILPFEPQATSDEKNKLSRANEEF